MEPSPNYLILGLFGASSFLSFLNAKWQSKETNKANKILDQKRWKVGELYNNAIEKYKELGIETSEMDYRRVLYKQQIIQGYLNSKSPISIDGYNNDCLLVLEASERETISKMQSSKKRLDGKESTIKDIFSIQRDTLYKNNIKCYQSGNYAITDGVTTTDKGNDQIDMMYFIPLETEKMHEKFVTFSWIGNLNLSSLNSLKTSQFKLSKEITPPGGSLNFEKNIIPSVLPLLTTMQFPFYSASGIYLAKNTFKLGIKTNLPVWLFCDINFSTLNGSLSFNNENLKMFFSFKDLKNHILRKANSNGFWKMFFAITAVASAIWFLVDTFGPRAAERRRAAEGIMYVDGVREDDRQVHNNRDGGAPVAR